MKNSTIYIDNLLIRACDPTSAVRQSYPATDCFDDRSDFMLLDHTDCIAVTFEAVYVGDTLAPGQCIRRRLVATVYDTDTDLEVASRDFVLAISAWSQCQRPRVDIPLGSLGIFVGNNYEVRITGPGRSRVYASRPLRFFDPRRSLPRHFSVQSVAVVDRDDRAPYRCFDASRVEDGSLILFKVQLSDDVYPWWMPEMFVRLVRDNDCSTIRPAEVRVEVDPLTGRSTGMVQATYDITYTDMQPCTIYAELLVLGYPCGGALLTFDDWSLPGEFTGDETAVIREPELSQRLGEAIEERRHHRPDAVAARAKLDSLVGLDRVKSKLSDYTHLMRFNQLRLSAGLGSADVPMHALFLGSPGTGKTTVAKIMGSLMHDLGVLSRGHVVVRERATLLGQYYNSEAEKTREALEEARGGILFIDEAYQLFQPHDAKDPGRFVLETLMTALADESDRDWMLILAGYTEPMLKMLSLNPGLSSRLPVQNHYYFDDFSPEQLGDIAMRYFADHQYTLTPEAIASLQQLLRHDYECRSAEFGNGRHVLNMIQTGILPAMARRVAAIPHPSAAELSTIIGSDIPAPAAAPRRRPSVGFNPR